MRHGSIDRLATMLAAAFVLSASAISAQTTNATLQGTVTDSGGGVIPGVTVKLESPSTGLKRDSITNAAGVYGFNFLPAGAYVITAELSGFKSVKHSDVALEIGQTRELNVRLDVGRLEEVVDVAGTATVLDRTSAAIGTVIGSSQLKQLPLAGRHWATLMMLAPGAINTGDGTHLSIRFVGRARDDNNWTFDGIDATGVKDPRQDSTTRLIISTESVAEFRVSSSMYSAASGTAAGGQVQLISKTGSNSFRGTAYDFIRNDKFDAKPFGTVGKNPPFTLNQFGGNLGGPLVQGRTFFFANYEGLRQRQTQTFVRFVPSAAFRAAAPPALQSVVSQWPSGTSPTSDPNIDEWRINQQVTADENAGLLRLDHRFSDKTTMFGRYNFDRAVIVNPTDTGFTNGRLNPANFIFQLQRIFSANVVNELKFGDNASLRNDLRDGPVPQQIGVSGFVNLTGSQTGPVEEGRSSAGVITSKWAARSAAFLWPSAKGTRRVSAT